MFLEKLEIQGFKSFANKNSLVFPGMLVNNKRGITAVVGPNGSGKSNVADAVRWALGEQSMKTLRGKKSEDIIFSGSDKKGKAGMAEVSLYLNNEDKQAPIDYSQIVLTRRLYRNGESEYLLNNNRARLSDIQMLLAKANFGQKTYSVIGQGMVEGFLNTSLAERKEFFDEATGVKQYQIKRDDSLNKLRSSHENLDQVQMLLAEIEPRLKSLTRQVSKLHKRDELEKELTDLQLNYYGQIWTEINGKFNTYNKQFLGQEKEKIEKDKKLAANIRKLEQLEKEEPANQEFTQLQNALSSLQMQHNQITKQLAKLEAQLEVSLESTGQFDLSWLNNRKKELESELKKTEADISQLKKEYGVQKTELDNLSKEKTELSLKITNHNQLLLTENSSVDETEIKQINSTIKKLIDEIESAEKDADLEKIKLLINKIKTELSALLNLSNSREQEENLKKARQEVITFAENREKLSEKISSLYQSFSARSERIKLFNDKLTQLSSELSETNNKLAKYQNQLGADQTKKERANLEINLKDIDQKIIEVNEKINSISKVEEQKRAELFELQRNTQNLQGEINYLNNQLNEIKISATRYETKLEDLEREIRGSLINLQNIKTGSFNQINLEITADKINSLKHQLEQIGGIDPEIEKEYNETKERYDFLSGQVNDLIAAISSLEKIIRELDVAIKEKFDKEFKKIAEKFEEYFKILFNGGNAKIIKVLADEKEMEEENMEGKEGMDMKKIKFLQKHNATGLAGVEIKATPPGKKIQTVTMLSGGERALTAIALISAIISANPSPFVVLDEVDAALDESNSERLAKILDDLSNKTQFIVITHNRASMRRANILYGITMQEDGISKLLSVKLDEVVEKAAR